ncbi:hypothetical protein A6A11_00665 [Bisgaardia hudsonensis]|nr:hypothetical protein A6A11_00665 [Bisgaardia hudsonensis]
MIELVANALESSGCVRHGYAQAILEREQQISTFLENGIAIPHGSLDSRSLVLKTGVEIFQFPDGVEWGDGNIAYIVIGIAANSDEHLPLLQKLTHLLKEETKARRLAHEMDISTFKAMLLNEDLDNLDLFYDINLSVDTESLLTLIGTNIEKLHQQGCIDNDFTAEVISSPALPLGNGIWITDSTIGNKRNALVFSRPKKSFLHNAKEISGVLTISMVNDQMNKFLSALFDPNIQRTLLSGTDEDIHLVFDSLLDFNPNMNERSLDLNEQVIEKEFTIYNQHGLHTRPATVLVNIIKKYNASVLLQNLSNNSDSVSARSPIKLVSLGVLKGHRVKFIAKGIQAKEVINAIENAIFSGLGEIL